MCTIGNARHKLGYGKLVFYIYEAPGYIWMEEVTCIVKYELLY